MCRKSGRRISILLVCVMGGLYLDSCVVARNSCRKKVIDFGVPPFPTSLYVVAVVMLTVKNG